MKNEKRKNKKKTTKKEKSKKPQITRKIPFFFKYKWAFTLRFLRKF